MTRTGTQAEMDGPGGGPAARDSVIAWIQSLSEANKHRQRILESMALTTLAGDNVLLEGGDGVGKYGIARLFADSMEVHTHEIDLWAPKSFGVWAMIHGEQAFQDLAMSWLRTGESVVLLAKNLHQGLQSALDLLGQVTRIQSSCGGGLRASRPGLTCIATMLDEATEDDSVCSSLRGHFLVSERVGFPCLDEELEQVMEAVSDRLTEPRVSCRIGMQMLHAAQAEVRGLGVAEDAIEKLLRILRMTSPDSELSPQMAQAWCVRGAGIDVGKRMLALAKARAYVAGRGVAGVADVVAAVADSLHNHLAAR